MSNPINANDSAESIDYSNNQKNTHYTNNSKPIHDSAECSQNSDSESTSISKEQQPLLYETEDVPHTYKHNRQYTRFVYEIPESFENFFRKFDDTLIKAAQHFHSKPVLAFSLLITALTNVEVGVAVPYVLFILGIDDLASEYAYLMLILMFISQIPKRFLFRVRPYLRQRAMQFRNDKTSSFPSRAVTCGVVYGFAAWAAIQYARGVPTFDGEWWTPLVMLLIMLTGGLAASFARVNFGVHYPSDCLFGILQGTLVVTLGSLIHAAQAATCLTCLKKECYATVADRILRYGTLYLTNFYLLAGLSVGFLALTALFVVKPLHFWVKCHHVFGILLPCITFQLVFLCKNLSATDSTLPAPRSPPAWYTFVYAISTAVTWSAIGIKTKGKYSIIAFVGLYIVVFCAIACWRLGDL